MQFPNEVKHKAGEFLKENATLLLTFGGVIGTAGTAVLAARGGMKYTEILMEKKMKIADEMIVEDPTSNPSLKEIEIPKKELLLATAPQFIAPVLVGSGTIAMIIFSHRMSSAKIAGLAAAYGLAERNLTEYKEKVAEKLTGTKQKQVADEIAQDRVNRTGGHDSIVVVEGEVLCFDEPTGRYFRSTMEKIKTAVNSTNNEILKHEFADASFFYEELDLPATTWTKEVGWNRDQLVELEISTVMKDNRPCISIDFKYLPTPDFVPKHY